MSATVSEPAVPSGAAVDAQPAKRSAIGQAGENRLTRLESLRALGWIAVFLTHVLYLSLAGVGLAASYKNRLIYGGGLLALYLFYTMSAYLLFLPFARHQLRSGRKIDVKKYARNRMLRILPLYYTVVAVLLIIQPLSANRSDWWRWATFTQNFSPDSIHRLDAPLWSVAVEMQFYILLPVIAWAIAKVAGRSYWRTVAILVVGGLVSWAVRSHYVVHAPVPNNFGWLGRYALTSYGYAFVGGMLLAVARLAWEERTPRWASRRILGASSAWIVAAIALELYIAYDLSLAEPYIAFVAVLIVGACVLPLRPGRVVNALEWRPLAALGVASFSLYLWHWPILQQISGTRIDGSPGGPVRIIGHGGDFKTLLVEGILPCIAVGVVSYWLIERPFLRKRRGWGTTGTAPPAAPAPAAEAPAAPAASGAGS